ncbi:response regulator [Flavisolibacter nicotianae]|uniref:response regulator n=1 Tax=Flavisolibacter nicotianae TaxID=2364882 RepID=UPI000EB3173B|nr:response regulator [Flavisolibacter nicotianae]
MKQKPVILYADDDPDDRELLRETIREKGVLCELVETANGRETLLYLRSTKGIKNPPCLLLLDLNMPVLNGRETLAIIKSELDTQSIPVIVFTTSSSPLDEEFCKRFAVEMMTKPSSPEELGRVADKLLTYCSCSE